MERMNPIELDGSVYSWKRNRRNSKSSRTETHLVLASYPGPLLMCGGERAWYPLTVHAPPITQNLGDRIILGYFWTFLYNSTYTVVYHMVLPQLSRRFLWHQTTSPYAFSYTRLDVISLNRQVSGRVVCLRLSVCAASVLVVSWACDRVVCRPFVFAWQCLM